MLDVADPALPEAGGFGELHLTDPALGADGNDGASESSGIRRWMWHDQSRFAVQGQESSSASAPAPSQPCLAPHDLRDPLVAHAHDLRNGVHRQAIGIGSSDRLVPLLSERFASPVKRLLALGVVLGEGRESRFGLGCLAFCSGDAGIV